MKKILMLLSIVLLATSVQAGSLFITWDANTESDFDGYKLYYAPPTEYTLVDGMWVHSGNYPTVIDITDEALTSYTIPDILVGPQGICLTAYDTSGNESDYSEAITSFFVVPGVPPIAPPVEDVSSAPSGVSVEVQQ